MAASAIVDAMKPVGEPNLQWWADRLAEQCSTARDELLELTPWMQSAQDSVADSGLTRIPTLLRELAGLAIA
ncbi:hypothetical protein LP419_17075 [Massilia sp. H-1]|nr:hypothetical protein LP419_17075 [Massilia sp. H-1]